MLLNLESSAAIFESDRLALSGRVLVETHADREGTGVSSPLELRPDEGVVVEEAL